MPFLAQEHFPLSNEDILTWTFDHVKYDRDEPIYIDALKPERSISARQANKLVRQLAAGFKALGLKKGDCVSIHSFNGELHRKYASLKDAWLTIFLVNRHLLPHLLPRCNSSWRRLCWDQSCLYPTRAHSHDQDRQGQIRLDTTRSIEQYSQGS